MPPWGALGREWSQGWAKPLQGFLGCPPSPVPSSRLCLPSLKSQTPISFFTPSQLSPCGGGGQLPWAWEGREAGKGLAVPGVKGIN